MRWIPLSLLLAIFGCSAPPPPPAVPADWQTITVRGAFTFRAPPDLAPVPVQGIDSLVGQYASPSMELTFDYGPYSDPLERDGFTSRSVTIDGRSARLARSSDGIGIHIPSVYGKTRLTVFIRPKPSATPFDATAAERVLQSIDFPDA